MKRLKGCISIQKCDTLREIFTRSTQKSSFKPDARKRTNSSNIADSRGIFLNRTERRDEWNARNQSDTYERSNKITSPRDRRDSCGKGGEHATETIGIQYNTVISRLRPTQSKSNSSASIITREIIHRGFYGIRWYLERTQAMYCKNKKIR
jgi:hypothetical protein